MPDSSILLTVPEAAALLRLGRDATYRLVAQGQVPYVKLGGAVRIPKRALIDYIECRAQESLAEGLRA